MGVTDIGELVKVLFVRSRPAGLLSNSELELPISCSEACVYSDRGDSIGKDGVREHKGAWEEDLGFGCPDGSFNLGVLLRGCWSIVKVGSFVDLSEFLDLNSPVVAFVINQS